MPRVSPVYAHGLCWGRREVLLLIGRAALRTIGLPSHRAEERARNGVRNVDVVGRHARPRHHSKQGREPSR
jgi:hypothetical protein